MYKILKDVFIAIIAFYLIIGFIIICWLFSARYHTKQPINDPRMIGPYSDIVLQIEKCESFGKKVIHYNDGSKGLHSYYWLQFQKPTFERFWKLLINKDIDSADVYNLITDRDSQILLANKMLESDWNNWMNWKNCGEKLGLTLWSTPVEIAALK